MQRRRGLWIKTVSVLEAQPGSSRRASEVASEAASEAVHPIESCLYLL